MRKLASIFAVFVIIFCLVATAKNLGFFPTDFSKVELSYENSQTERLYYEGLTENTRIAYTLILPELPKHAEKIEIPKLSDSELDSLMYAISYDNPELICYGRSCEMFMEGGKYYFKPLYAHSKADCEECQRQFNEALNRALNTIPKNGSDFEKELAIHDYICKNCRYVADDYDNLKISPYDMLVKGEAVCEGYARTAQLLMNLSGIKNYLVTGESDVTGTGRTGHMWNVVTLNGENYYLDVTWDDIDEQTEDIDGCYLFFNVPEEIICRDHFNIVPADNKCTSYNYNYYNVNNSLYTAYDHTQQVRLENSIKRNTRNSKSVCEMYFTNEAAYQRAVKELIDDSKILDLLADSNKNNGTSFKEVAYYNVQNAYYIRFAFS